MKGTQKSLMLDEYQLTSLVIKRFGGIKTPVLFAKVNSFSHWSLSRFTDQYCELGTNLDES